MDEDMEPNVRLALLGLEHMFKDKSFFSICTVDACIKVLEPTFNQRDYEALRALHCMDWSSMTPDMKKLVRKQVCDLLNIQLEEPAPPPPVKAPPSLIQAVIGQTPVAEVVDTRRLQMKKLLSRLFP